MKVIFVESAFRHGYAEEDFFGVLLGRCMKLRSQRGISDVYEVLGRNLSGEYLHVVYRVLPDGILRVFHMARMTAAEQRRFRRSKS